MRETADLVMLSLPARLNLTFGLLLILFAGPLSVSSQKSAIQDTVEDKACTPAPLSSDLVLVGIHGLGSFNCGTDGISRGRRRGSGFPQVSRPHPGFCRSPGFSSRVAQAGASDWA